MRGWYKPVTAIIEPEWDDDPLPIIERLADNVRNGRDLVAPVNWDEQIKGMSYGQDLQATHLRRP